MTTWLAGMRITAERLNDHTLEEDVASGVVAESGWSVSGFSGRRVSGITTVHILLTRDGAIINEVATTSGNLVDISIGTLPAGWRPPHLINAVWGNGSTDGECTINTDGTISLRSISGDDGINTGTNVRIYTAWISEND